MRSAKDITLEGVYYNPKINQLFLVEIIFEDIEGVFYSVLGDKGHLKDFSFLSGENIHIGEF